MLEALFNVVKITTRYIESNDYGAILHLICQSSSSTNLKILQYLTAHKARVDCLDSQGRIPLHYAASVSLELVKLCYFPTAANIQDNCGDTPLHIACFCGNFEIINYFSTNEKCNVMAQNMKGETPLLKACKCDSLTPEILNVLLANVRKFQYDKDKNYPLHILCKYFSINKLPCFYLLIEKIKHCKQKDTISKQNEFNETPLHFLCKSKVKEALDALKSLLSLSNCINIQTLSGDTPLHLACVHGRHDIVKLLLKVPETDINITNQRNDTALHVLCSVQLISTCLFDEPKSYDECKKNVDSYLMLIDDALKGLATSTTINASNIEGDTPLHSYLKNDYRNVSIPYMRIESIVNFSCKVIGCLLKLGASRDICNNNGELPIHLACKNHFFEIIRLIGAQNNSHLTCTGDSIVHCACMFDERAVDDIQTLIKVFWNHDDRLLHMQNAEGNLPLHFVCKYSFCKAEIVRYMIDKQCDINCQNNNRDTPLHLISRQSREDNFIMYAILKGNYDSLVANNDGITFLDKIADEHRESLAEKLFFAFFCDSAMLSKFLKNTKFVLQLLLSPLVSQILLATCSIDPSLLYRAHHNFFGDQCTPPTIPVPILFIGDPMTGKTTLIQSLKKESGLEVNERDPERTAGIIPNSFRNEKYGDVTAYDFAGQREYYASHETVMQNILQKLPPIVVINVKLNESIQAIESKIIYWCNFIENRLKGLSRKSHLIIIFSHADLVTNEDPGTLSQEIIKSLSPVLLKSVFERVESADMDCREFKGEAMSRLVSRLTQSTNSIRHHGVLDFNAHCLLVFLIHNFTNKVALRLGECLAQFQKHKRDDPVLSLLPIRLADVLRLFEELSLTGQIMFIKDEFIQLKSWIVLRKEVLLNEITGRIFAPPDFSAHDSTLHLSETGVIPFSTIRRAFHNYDPNMIVAFLQSIEYCYEIQDEYVMKKLFKAFTENFEKCYFFPALVTADRPLIKWYESTEKCVQFGWVLKCKNVHQFFTPRFIQSLLLHLIFGKTRITSKPVLRDSFEGVESVSRIWKSGLHWFDGNGIETVVDVVATASKVMVFMCCDTEHKNRLLEHRSSLMKTIRNLAKEICPAVETAEFFVHCSHIKKILNKTIDSDYEHLTPMNYVCEAADNFQSHVVTPIGSFKTIDFIFLDFLDPCYFELTEQLFGRKLEKERSTHGQGNSLILCKPTLRDLYILKWQDEDGENKEFRLVTRVSAKWMEFGTYIGIEMNQLNAWKQEYVGNASLCWNSVMNYWLSGEGMQHYPPTWDGLYQLLNDAECASLASELRKAVKCAFSQEFS